MVRLMQLMLPQSTLVVVSIRRMKINEIIPFEYQDITDGGKDQLIVNKGGWLGFEEYGVFVTGGKWGVIDISNKVKVPIIYDEVSHIMDNYIVRKGAKINEYGGAIGGKYGVVTSENKNVIPLTYDYINESSSGNSIIVALGCQTYSETEGLFMPHGGKWGAFDQKGKIILTTNFSEITTTSDPNLLILNFIWQRTRRSATAHHDCRRPPDG